MINKQSSITTIFLVLIFLTAANTIFAQGQEAAEPDKGNAFFPIGVYFVRGQKPIIDEGGNVDFRSDPKQAGIDYSREFADLANEGFNSAVISINPIAFGDHFESVIAELLSAAENNNIKLLLPLEHLQSLLAEMRDDISNSDIAQALCQDYISYFANSKAVLAFIIYDEPSPGDTVNVEQLGQARAYLESHYPDKIVLSSWADVDNMAELQEGMQSKVLFMDIYPISEDSAIGDFSDAWPRGNAEDGSFALGEDQPSYFEYLDMAREAAPNLPQWLIIQAFEPIPPEHPHYWRLPTPKEMRLEVFSGLAHGAKGIFYFLYQSESWVHGLRDANYKKTPLLDEAMQINEKLRAMSETLLGLERDQVNKVGVNQGEAFSFSSANNEHYIFVVNTDVESETLLEITLPTSWQNSKTLEDVYNHEVFTITANIAKIRLEPGDGRLLKLLD